MSAMLENQEQASIDLSDSPPLTESQQRKPANVQKHPMYTQQPSHQD